MRKVLIFGATSSIAMETAKLFAADADAFFLVARDENKLNSVKNDLMVHGASKIDYEVADLNDFENHGKIIERANQFLEGFDTVLIAHGTLSDQQGCEKDYNLAEKEIRTNFLNIVSLLTIIANEFEKKKNGCIAVISSVAGDRGRQSNYIYGTAKGAVSIFLQGLRNRLYSSGVSVITIKPGFVDTPMTTSYKKGLLFVNPDVIAKGIYNAIKRKKDVVYLPSFWWLIALVIKTIPEFMFKRLKL